MLFAGKLRCAITGLFALCLVATASAQQQVKSDTTDVVYQFPSKAADWEHDPKSLGWKVSADGSFADTAVYKATTFLPIDFPEKVELEMTLVSSGGFPQYHLGFSNISSNLHLETWDDTLIGLAGEEFVEIETIPRGARSQTLRLFLDSAKQLLQVYGTDGKLLAVLNGKAPAAAATKESRPGLFLQNHGQHLAVTGLRVSKWDGKPPGPQQVPANKNDPIYLGPDSGRGWKLSPENSDEGLSFWSTNRDGFMITHSVGSAFHPLENLPSQCEVELGLVDIARPTRKGGIDVGLQLSAQGPTTGLAIIDGHLFARLGSGKSPLSPLGLRKDKKGLLTIRLFRKELDDGNDELSLYTANGGLLGTWKVARSRKMPGIRISTQTTLAIAKVRVSHWDGNAPKPIPGG